MIITYWLRSVICQWNIYFIERLAQFNNSIEDFTRTCWKFVCYLHEVLQLRKIELLSTRKSYGARLSCVWLESEIFKCFLVPTSLIVALVLSRYLFNLLDKRIHIILKLSTLNSIETYEAEFHFIQYILNKIKLFLFLLFDVYVSHWIKVSNF